MVWIIINTSNTQQQSSASDPWQQPQTSDRDGGARQDGAETATCGTVVVSKEKQHSMVVFDGWPQQQQHQQAGLPQQQTSLVQQQQQETSAAQQHSQWPGLKLTFGSFDRCDSGTDSDWLSVTSSDSADLLPALPMIERSGLEAPSYMQQATRRVELINELSDQHKATPAQIGASDHDSSGDNGLGAHREADVGSDDSDIADMLTMLACH